MVSEVRLAFSDSSEERCGDGLASMTNRARGTMIKAAINRKVDAEASTQEPGS